MSNKQTFSTLDAKPEVICNITYSQLPVFYINKDDSYYEWYAI